VYNQLNQFVSQENWFAMNEHSTDELMGPTRGTDWDDFGTWRKLHQHTWDGAHNQVNNTWNGLNGALFQTTLLAESTTAPAADRAEGRFLRAFFSYQVVDLYGQLQTRPATAAIADVPSVKTRSEAIDFIIAELRAVIPQLPVFNRTNRTKATKEAAQFLLAKCLLNKAVYKADPANPAGPFTFAAADMSEVVTLCDAIQANPNLSMATNYWDNFTWTSGTTSTESIFVRSKVDADINMVWATCMGNHYNMPPDGWNGFTTLSEFYDSFEDGDIRKSYNLPGFTNLTGRPAGFLIGQQRGPVGKSIGNAIVDLKDRSGNPLVFTKTASLFFSTESRGIRTNKYPLNPAEMNGGGWGSTNEYIFMRLGDVRLMEAEAILRGGTATGETPAAIVGAIRANRGATALASVTLTNVLAERGRELYLEAHRRNDLIRFGKFLDPVSERSATSAATKVVFPIPNIALSSNPNLKQNAGY
jgi:starch-binding outer membrane protein, SusD/RagB family